MAIKLAKFKDQNQINKTRTYDRIYAPPYNDMTTGERLLLMSNIASDNGKCWWIKRFLTNNKIGPKKPSIKRHWFARSEVKKN